METVLRQSTKRVVIIAAMVVAALVAGGTAVAARGTAVEVAPVWERCWVTAKGTCKYKCNAPDPKECPCDAWPTCGGVSLPTPTQN